MVNLSRSILPLVCTTSYFLSQNRFSISVLTKVSTTFAECSDSSVRYQERSSMVQRFTDTELCGATILFPVSSIVYSSWNTLPSAFPAAQAVQIPTHLFFTPTYQV